MIMKSNDLLSHLILYSYFVEEWNKLNWIELNSLSLMIHTPPLLPSPSSIPDVHIGHNTF